MKSKIQVIKEKVEDYENPFIGITYDTLAYEGFENFRKFVLILLES